MNKLVKMAVAASLLLAGASQAQDASMFVPIIVAPIATYDYGDGGGGRHESVKVPEQKIIWYHDAKTGFYCKMLDLDEITDLYLGEEGDQAVLCVKLHN